MAIYSSKALEEPEDMDRLSLDFTKGWDIFKTELMNIQDLEHYYAEKTANVVNYRIS